MATPAQKAYQAETRAQVLARVDQWRLYYLAEAKMVGDDYSARSLALSNAQRVAEDLAYLKRGTNWREFNDGTPYAYGSRTAWYTVYPRHVACPLP